MASSIGAGIELVLFVSLVLLLIRLVATMVQQFARDWTPRGVVLIALEGTMTMTDPPIRAVRRLLPPLQLGGVALDLGFIVVILLVYVLRVLNGSLMINQ